MHWLEALMITLVPVVSACDPFDIIPNASISLVYKQVTKTVEGQVHFK